jgi:hypothetical protein
MYCNILFMHLLLICVLYNSSALDCRLLPLWVVCHREKPC